MNMHLVDLIEDGIFFSQAALACGVSAKTVSEWYRRFQAEGAATAGFWSADR